MSACMIHLHALRPLHIGTGAADGAIDLPHSRETGTGYPNAPGSGLKGVIRDEFAGANHASLEKLFGPKPGDAGDNAAGVANGKQGALMFSDGLLLCLPVRSVAGGFAWVSSPLTLLRYARERAALGLVDNLAAAAASMQALAVDGCACATGTTLISCGAAHLQDLTLTKTAALDSTASTVASKLASLYYPDTDSDHKEWRALFVKQFTVTSEPVFGYLCDMAMDVRARVRLKEDSKTAVGGALWYEESLPAESMLWATVAADPLPPQSASQVMKDFVAGTTPLHRTRLGGKVTVGRGLARCLVEVAP